MDWLINILAGHVGHNVVIVEYGNQNISLECDDCNEVLVDSSVLKEFAKENNFS